MQTIAAPTSICCRSTSATLAPDEAARLARVFKALADPTRIAIVHRLSGAESVCVCELTDAFELSQPTISHHLKQLRDAGLVESERRGTWAHYRLVPDALEQLRAVFETSA